MAEIKSALELALEKADRLGRASDKEMQEAELRDRARHLAADFLRQRVELGEEIGKFPSEARPLMLATIKEVLIHNITLPREFNEESVAPRIQVGLLQVAGEKNAMQQKLNEVIQLIDNYQKVRQNAYQQLHAKFTAGLNNVQRALEAQIHMHVKIDVAHTPQFQEEWSKFESQLLSQFEALLQNIKAQMTTL